MKSRLTLAIAAAILLVALTGWSCRTTRVAYAFGTYELHRLLGRIVRIDSIDRKGIRDVRIAYSWNQPYRPIGCGPEPLLFCVQTIHDANLDGKWDTWLSAAGRTNGGVLVKCELDTKGNATPDMVIFGGNNNMAALDTRAKALRGFGIWRP